MEIRSTKKLSKHDIAFAMLGVSVILIPLGALVVAGDHRWASVFLGDGRIFGVYIILLAIGTVLEKNVRGKK